MFLYHKIPKDSDWALKLYLSEFTGFFTVFMDISISMDHIYRKTCLKLSLKKDQQLVFKTDYHLMHVESIAECSKGEHSAIQ